MSRGRIALLLLLVALIAAFFAFGLDRYFRLEHFKAQQAAIEAFHLDHPLAAGAAFFAVYVAYTGLSLPGASLLTLAAGALFGFGWGTLLVSFASSSGATLAFAASRYLFRDALQSRWGDRLRAINAGVEKEGALYLFALRLVPLFPFFMINLLMGLTPLRAWTFYWVSQAGMLAGTLVYVNAGTRIAQIESLSGLITVDLVASLLLLGIFPLLARHGVTILRARRVYARWRRPARFERNLVVIGAGSAGLVSAYIAAAVKAKVTLIEKHRMGGDCLNTGCVPSKALIRTTRALAEAKRARELGLKSINVEFDFAEVMERVQRIIREIEPHDSVERYRALGVECLAGEATITSPWTVAVRGSDGSERSLTTRAIIIAAGARPFIAPIPGLLEAGCLTSDNIWELRELPRRLVVLGGGPIGAELAQCFARLGSQVTLVEMMPRLLLREDPEVSAMVLERFCGEGLQVRTGHKALRVLVQDGQKILVCEHQGVEVPIAFDAILCALGRIANTSGYGLEALGIPVTRSHTVETNDYLQTLYPNIYACGDVAGPYQFTHIAAHTAWYAAVNALFGSLHRFRVDFSVIPWATFTDPEVARVGLNETEAAEKGIAYEVTTYGIDGLDRAIVDSQAHGLVKILTVPGRDRILGATIVGEHAAELIIEFVTAMRHGIGLNKILGTIHIYPTRVEANKYAAGNWKRAHAPQRLLAWAGRFHHWMRS